ncbi:hypothetical protein VTN49DRAFT_3804 [Thermomyces lanuginosus]|uniref:uncharacterized protein n=1 Tax=Thermomyces lanuginosus TaxID=5541 RepID=UPI0037439F07
MKLLSVSVVAAAILSGAAAQGVDGLPKCAQSCVTGAIPEHCSGFDVGCICGDDAFIDKMACCVSKECEGDDINAVLSFANGICTGAGVTVPTEMPPNPCANQPSATKSSTSTTGSSTSTTQSSATEDAAASSSESTDFAAPTANAHTGMMAAMGAAGAMAALGLM